MDRLSWGERGYGFDSLTGRLGGFTSPSAVGLFLTAGIKNNISLYWHNFQSPLPLLIIKVCVLKGLGYLPGNETPQEPCLGSTCSDLEWIAGLFQSMSWWILCLWFRDIWRVNWPSVRLLLACHGSSWSWVWLNSRVKSQAMSSKLGLLLRSLSR